MTEDAITRAEHLAAMARLDAADAALRASIIETERALRSDYEDKIAVAVTDLKTDIVGVRDAMATDVGFVRSDVGKVESHLTWQDRAVGGGVVTFFILLALQLTNHIFG